MKTSLLSLISFALVIGLQGQLVISDTFNGPSLSGEQIDVSGAPQSADIEHSLYVRNVSDAPLTLKVRRYEEDVQPNTYNNMCWFICPATPQYAGDAPDWTTSFSVTIQPGGTDSSFAFHYTPNGELGCSFFRLQWVNADDLDESYEELYMRVVHGNESCASAVGLEDLNDEIEVTIVPNPSNDHASLVIEGVDTAIGVQVMDVLGQVVMEHVYSPYGDSRMVLNTSGLRNGIYFVSIVDQDEILRTLKLVVKH